MSNIVQINNDGYIGKKKPVLYKLKTPTSKHKNQKRKRKGVYVVNTKTKTKNNYITGYFFHEQYHID